MKNTELRAYRISTGFNVKQMAKMLNTPYRTYQDWELGNRKIPGIVDVVISELKKGRLSH